MKLLNILIVIYINSCGAQDSKDSPKTLHNNTATSAYIVEDMDQAPICNAKQKYLMIYVENESQFYTCLDQGYVAHETPL